MANVELALEVLGQIASGDSAVQERIDAAVAALKEDAPVVDEVDEKPTKSQVI